MLTNQWKTTIVIGIIVSTLIAVTLQKIDYGRERERLEQERVKKAQASKTTSEEKAPEQQKQTRTDAALLPRVETTQNQIPAKTIYAKPSFDCAKARAKTEMIICSDAELAQLDVELSLLYKQAQTVVSDKEAFKKVNLDEWKKREATCFDRQCLLAWYDNRRVQLKMVIAGRAQ